MRTCNVSQYSQRITKPMKSKIIVIRSNVCNCSFNLILKIFLLKAVPFFTVQYVLSLSVSVHQTVWSNEREEDDRDPRALEDNSLHHLTTWLLISHDGLRVHHKTLIVRGCHPSCMWACHTMGTKSDFVLRLLSDFIQDFHSRGWNTLLHTECCLKSLF